MNRPKPRIGIISKYESESLLISNHIRNCDSLATVGLFRDSGHWSSSAHSEPYIVYLLVRDDEDFTEFVNRVQFSHHCVIINVINLVEPIQDYSLHQLVFEAISINQLEALSMLNRLSSKAILDRYKHQQVSQRHHNFIQTSPVGMFRMDIKGHLLSANSMMSQIAGYANVDHLFNDLHSDFTTLFCDQLGFNKFFEEVASGRTDLYFESQIDRGDGALAWVSVKGALTVNDVTGKSGIDFVVTDITGAKEVEEQVYYDSIHDSLTGLYNRLFIVEKLDEILHSQIKPFQSFGVLMFDLDHFQKVNDIFGHKEGDRLILQLTRRLKKIYQNKATLARLGGDEFILVFNKNLSESELILEGDRLLILFEEPFKIAESDYRIKASIGLKYCDDSTARGDEVLRDVDTAMNRAKLNGRGRWVLFHEGFITEIKHRLILEKELRAAIETDQFEVFYQPIINTVSSKIDGFEALIRWMHPEKGMISPVEFIPVAEESNLILPLGEYVLRTVVKQIKEWHLLGFSHLVGAVNTSVRQFQMTNINHLVHDILQESDLAPHALKIEVTESLAMNNVDYTISTFKDLDQSGVKISIDDFGTGYSSLSYLKKFPFHTLKIDRSFVNEIQTKGDDAEITRAIIVMAQSLGLEIVAEGVETQEQLDFLENLGCDYYQGYLFSKPLPSAEFERLLHRNLAS